MPVNPKELSNQADELRRDWSFLNQFDIDPSKIQIRSKVFQQNFHENGRTVPVFVKIYTYKKSPFQRLWRAATSRSETRNLIFFQSIGIASPRVVGWGLRRNFFGKIVEEFIVTEAVTDSQMLTDFVATACPDRSTQEYCHRRDSIINQLGRWTRAMHDNGFFHQDLKWRNILGRMSGEDVELYWIDCPKGDFSSFSARQRHGRLKDCATLDKRARLQCTREERQCFVAAYLNLAIDAPEVEAFSAAISHYRQNRFDAEDDRQLADAAKQK